MKVLVVGEGPHDQAVLPALVRKLCPQVEPAEFCRWTDVSRFGHGARKGLAGKVLAAILISHQRRGYEGTVCVVDRDGDDTRAAALEQGRLAGLALVDSAHRAACGVAVESIEAWTLGAREALAEELSLPVERLHRSYPAGVHVEQLKESSGKPEHRPKTLLGQLCQLANQTDCGDLRRSVAERVDPETLRTACPKGFAPFAESLRSAFL